MSRVRHDGLDGRSNLVGASEVDVPQRVESRTADDVLRGPLGNLRREGFVPRGLRALPAFFAVHVRELAAAVPLREFQEGRSEEPRQAKGSRRIPRPLTRGGEVRKGLREESDALERDPRIGVIPERWVRSETHQGPDKTP